MLASRLISIRFLQWCVGSTLPKPFSCCISLHLVLGKVGLRNYFKLLDEITRGQELKISCSLSNNIFFDTGFVGVVEAPKASFTFRLDGNHNLLVIDVAFLLQKNCYHCFKESYCSLNPVDT